MSLKKTKNHDIHGPAAIISLTKTAQSFLVSAATLTLAWIYLLSWRRMPLYTDEIALRLQSARAFADGLHRHPLFPQCSVGGDLIGWPLAPAAYLVSALDFLTGFTAVRALTIGVVMAFLASVVLVCRQGRFPNAAAMLPAALVGVAGSGLVMMRMEFFLILQAITCLLAFLRLKSTRHRIYDFITVVALAIMASVSGYVHPQGLILLPVSAMLMVTIAIDARSRMMGLLGAGLLGFIVLSANATVQSFEDLCREAPSIAQAFADITITGTGQFARHVTSVAPWIDKLSLYGENSTFALRYNSDYLPGIQSSPEITVTNLLVKTCFFGILIAAVVVTVASAIKLLQIFVESNESMMDRGARLLRSPALYLALAGASHLALFVYDVQGNFYRSFYLNLMFTALVVIYIAVYGVWHRTPAVMLATLACLLCAQSARLTSTVFDPLFAEGWAGPSVPAGTDWLVRATVVDQLKNECGISQRQSRLVVDDATYDALRGHPHLIPLTYAGLGATLSQRPVPSLMTVIRGFGSGVVARCSYIGLLPSGSDDQRSLKRNGNLCCINFDRIAR